MQHKEKPPAELSSTEDASDDIFGYMAGKVKIVGDVVGPITPLEDWECMRAVSR